MNNKQFDRVNPPMPSLILSPQAAEKLQLYANLCPFEISGLGEIEIVPAGFLVRDLFLLKQRCYHTYTELLPDYVARFLISFVEQGKDPVKLKLWWHSHVDMDVFWSPIDDYTARGFQNDYMLSLVTNKAREHLCRLDIYQPLKLTIDRLPVAMPHQSHGEEKGIRDLILKEISEQIIMYSD
jgi:hypothetical protein